MMNHWDFSSRQKLWWFIYFKSGTSVLNKDYLVIRMTERQCRLSLWGRKYKTILNWRKDSLSFMFNIEYLQVDSQSQFVSSFKCQSGQGPIYIPSESQLGFIVTNIPLVPVPLTSALIFFLFNFFSCFTPHSVSQKKGEKVSAGQRIEQGGLFSDQCMFFL